MKYCVVGENGAPRGTAWADAVQAALRSRGHAPAAPGEAGASLILNCTHAAAPRAHYLRADASEFVVTLVESEDGDGWPDADALRRASYAILVKTMANVVVHRVRAGRHGGRAWIVTPELGFRSLPDDEALGAAVAAFVVPLAEARVVIENRLDPDLPPALWEGDETSRSLVAHGRELAAMDLLPSVFDLDALLDERDRRLLMKVFGIKQLSYGNLSARRDATSFWMSARGADKGRLSTVGKDVLLVKGYDAARGCLLLSVPPHADPDARVSVDAIEHFKIYEALPEVGAIVHVHAWIEGVEATTQSWPCGTEPMADEVLAILRRQPDPSRAVAGLKNHGLTLTGRTLEDVFDRIRGRLTQAVPVLE